MPINAVTQAIRGRLKAVIDGSLSVYVGPPDIGIGSSVGLILFLLRITPNADLRNTDRIRRFPDASHPPRVVSPAIPVDLHYLVTSAPAALGSTGPDDLGLINIAAAVQAIEAASPIAVPSHFQEAVWLSLEPLSSDELARIWGLFQNFNCRTSFIFRASPVWIDPLYVADPAPAVTSDTIRHRSLEAA